MLAHAIERAETTFRNRAKPSPLARHGAIAPFDGGRDRQPLLRGLARLAMVATKPAANVPERKAHAPFLFRHPRRETLEQLLTARLCVLPYPIGPAPTRVEMRARIKLPVIPQYGPVPGASGEALRGLSDEQPSAQAAEVFAQFKRPTTRGECANGIRPCPWSSCRHHLLLEVHPTSGAIHLNHATLEEMKETCSLDVVDRGESLTLEQLGDLVGCSNERVRQITLDAAPAFEGFGWPKLR